jgi:hypothetical protein
MQKGETACLAAQAIQGFFGECDFAVMYPIGFAKLLALLPTLCHTHLGDAPFVIDGTPG